MVNTKAIAGLLALSAALAACSGGSEGEADTSVQAEASTPAATDGPLAATDMSTVDGTTLANFTGNAANGKLVMLNQAGANLIGTELGQRTTAVLRAAQGTVSATDTATLCRKRVQPNGSALLHIDDVVDSLGLSFLRVHYDFKLLKHGFGLNLQSNDS